jgi:chromosome segregation ATPase
MKRVTTKKPQQDNQVLEILKKLTSRVEHTAADISSVKKDVRFINTRLEDVEHNTGTMRTEIGGIKNDMNEMKADLGSLKDDMNKMEEQLVEKINSSELRLHDRIGNVADLITVDFGKKIANNTKRIQKLEHAQLIS